MIPKVIVNGMIVPLTLSVLLNGCSSQNVEPEEIVDNVSYESEYELEENKQDHYNIDLTNYDESTQRAYKSYLNTVNDKKNLYTEESYSRGPFGTSIYDSKGLNRVLNNTKEDVTYDDIREQINNLDIDPEIKEIYLTLANNLEQQYPNLDLRIWSKNLETLEFEYKPEHVLDACGIDSGYYSIDRNKITLQEGLVFTPGTIEYQILVHELAHTIRNANFTIDGQDYYCRFSTSFNNYEFTDESFNSILALRSYDPDETMIAYTLSSHLYEIMIECMENYTMEDYVNEDISYFIKQLNETNGDTLAIEMINLIELRSRDTRDESFSIPQECYYPLYDYVARMYYNKHITPDMTPEEIEQVKNELVTRIITDIPEKIEFDTSRFDDYLIEYCNEHNITYSSKSKTR